MRCLQEFFGIFSRFVEDVVQADKDNKRVEEEARRAAEKAEAERVKKAANKRSEASLGHGNPLCLLSRTIFCMCYLSFIFCALSPSFLAS